MYTLLALAAGALVWSYWTASRSRAPLKIGSCLLLFVSAGLIMYIHYAGAILLAAIGLYHLLFVSRDGHWWRISALIAFAALMFVFWLPVAIEGTAESSVLLETRLSPLAALGAGFAVYANGIVVLPVIALALIVRYRKRLNRAQRYILLIVCFAVLCLLALNEVTPLLVESRLRYLTFIAIPATAALAYGLQLLPAGKPLRMCLFAIWIAASFAFSRSAAFEVYTNRQALREDKLVHYQAFQYDLRDQPGFEQLIMSFHQGAPVVWKTIEYYRATLDQWNYVVHVTYDEDGQLLLQSGIPPTMTLDDIAEKFPGIWAIHNPAQTDLKAMAVYRLWFLERYKPCQRFVDQPENIIELYMHRAIPCDLLLAEQPLAIRFDNGMALDNIVVESSQDGLEVYFWWREIEPRAHFSFSLQVHLTRRRNKALGKDAVIWRVKGWTRDALIFRRSPPGEYGLKLIVYDFETGASQPGVIIGADQRFEREVEIYRFTVSD